MMAWILAIAGISGVGLANRAILCLLEAIMHRLVNFIGIFCAVALSSTLPASAQYLPPTANLLLRYDVDQDGSVSSAEVVSGVNADYALADSDGSNCISGQEIRSENDRRLSRDGGVASPIVDWNLDGCVNMNEFGSSIRSYFSYADRSGDGQVSTAELSGPSMPLTLPTRNPRARTALPPQNGTGTIDYDPDGTRPGGTDAFGNF